MAILVTNQSHFKPLSFDEMIRPYQMLTEEYNKREAEISALDTKAETMRQYADNEIRNKLQADGLAVTEDNINKWIKDNPNSFATKYMNYANSLDKAAEDLATKGLKGTNRKVIYDLTNQYQTNVVPIETALKTRTTKSDEQRKALLANPDLRFDRDFSTVGLQELIDNPDLGYTPYNLKDFEERGALSGAGILGRMTENVVLDPSEQWYNITKGVSQNDLIRWQSGDTDASHYDDAQSINALNAARAEATKIANTVPENLRGEVFNRVFSNSVNAMKQTTRERTNANFMSDYQRRQENRQLQNEEKQDALNAIKYGIEYNEDTKKYEYTEEKKKELIQESAKRWVELGVKPNLETGEAMLDSNGNPVMLSPQEKITMSNKLGVSGSNPYNTTEMASLGSNARVVNMNGTVADIPFSKIEEVFSGTVDRYPFKLSTLNLDINKDVDKDLYDFLNNKSLSKKLRGDRHGEESDVDRVKNNRIALKKMIDTQTKGYNIKNLIFRFVPSTQQIYFFEEKTTEKKNTNNSVQQVIG